MNLRVSQATANNSNYGTWEDFKKDFKRAFISDDEAKEAGEELFVIKQGSDTVSMYNNRFRDMATRAGITEFHTLAPVYRRGLNRRIWARILNRDTQPTAMETVGNVLGYYSIALDAERAVNQFNERFRDSQRNMRRDKPHAKIRAINQSGQMTREERTRLVQEGRCFRCKEKGHQSRNCPKNPGGSNRKPGTLNKYDVKKLRSAIAELSLEEMDELCAESEEDF